MLTLRCVKKTRRFLSPFAPPISLFSTVSSSALIEPSSPNPFRHSPPPIPKLQSEDIVLSLREWFNSGGNPLMERIYELLSAGNEDNELPRWQAVDLALSQLNLPLSEALVLEVLSYGRDVLSCLKFFDWAGRQPGFFHTRVTFNAIFKILTRAKLMSLMFDFLESYRQRPFYKVGFQSILVMGYAVAGKPEIALQIFGRMRFQGIDLDGFAYHVLLNALVEENCFDVVDMVAMQIKMQGHENQVTHSILIKRLCKQNELERAESYFRELIASGIMIRRGNEHSVGILVESFCKHKQFEKAGKLVEEFASSRLHDIWIRELIRANKFDGALEFLQKTKEDSHIYDVPSVFRYNVLISRLLRENRLEEVCDLLVEMKENNICPDEFTMNSVLCFFCKAGMLDVALELYDSRKEFGLSPDNMAYNYLINTLCGDGDVDDAYRVLRNSIEEGYLPGRKTFSILADSLCRLEKLDKMKELVLVALERNLVLSNSTYDKFVSALCRTSRVEDGYLFHGELSRLNKVASRSTYFCLIHGFNRSNRGDIAARLLIEMQEKGYNATRKLFREVIQSLCEMENPETQVSTLLEMQLSRYGPSSKIFNFFIGGVGHAKKPELARKIYEMMGRSGISPTLESDLLMLYSYLRNDKISDALSFFDGLSSTRKVGNKLCSSMVVGLCKAKRTDVALAVFSEMNGTGVRPSLQCYEELINLLCLHERFDTVVNIIDDFVKAGRLMSSFIGNVLLLHSLKTRKLYYAWLNSRSLQDGISCMWTLGELLDVFSSSIREVGDIEGLEEVINKCFPLDIYTYNMLLRKLSTSHIDDACKLFHNLCRKGYEPNLWSYLTLIHGFNRHGRMSDANLWTEEMIRRGFDPKDIFKARN